MAYTYSTVVGQIIKPYKDANVELMGILFNSFGIIGSIAVSIYVSRPAASMLNSTKGISVFMLFVLVVFWGVTAFLESLWPDYLMASLFGFATLPIFFTSYELAVEQTKHLTGVDEALPVGIINMLGNFFGMVELFYLTPILTKDSTTASTFACLLLGFQQIVAIVMILCVKRK
jgi:hypothetical protein